MSAQRKMPSRPKLSSYTGESSGAVWGVRVMFLQGLSAAVDLFRYTASLTSEIKIMKIIIFFKQI